MNIKNLISIAFVGLLISSCKSVNPQITSQELKDHIEYLASDSLKGRKPGTPEGKLAAEYIADNFSKIDLKKFDNSYFQSFEVVTNVEVGEDNLLELNGELATLGVDYRPFAFSSNSEVQGPVVFAGYGIDYSDEKITWNDFSNIDVKGKWVLVLRQDPDVDNSDSPLISLGTDRAKSLTAADKGAVGLLIVNGVNTEKKDEIDDLFFDKSSARADIPVIQISRAFADKLLKSSGKTIENIEKSIVDNFKSKSFELAEVLKAKTDIVYLKTTTQNVLGYFEGSDPNLKEEYIVIGAHYDHLGFGGLGSGSRAPDEHAVHNGADDNASGVAGMIELAQKISQGEIKPRRSVIFMGFAAEEMGLLGSKFFTENPSIDISKVKMMLNFDMVGRLDEGRLTIGGSGTTAITEDVIKRNSEGSGLEIAMSKEGSGPSDHSAFYVKNVPVLFFFTGIHDDYHTPADDADRINYDGEVQVLDLGYNIAMEFANMDEAPAFVQVDVPSQNTGRRKFKVTFGIVPNYGGGDEIEGMRVDGVKADGPAGKGGMQKGDIIVAVDGKKVGNIYDYMARLGKLKKGDRCNVDVIRDGEKVVLILDL